MEIKLGNDNRDQATSRSVFKECGGEGDAQSWKKLMLLRYEDIHTFQRLEDRFLVNYCIFDGIIKCKETEVHGRHSSAVHFETAGTSG